MADRIRKSVAGGMRRDDHQSYDYTASFGVAEWKPGERYGSLFERADRAMYLAKGNGRNRVVGEDEDPNNLGKMTQASSETAQVLRLHAHKSQ